MATVEKRGNNTYRLIVSDGFDSNGKRRYKKKTIKLDENLTEKQKEKELQKQIVLFEKEVDNGNYLDGSKITFGEFINQWLSTYAEKEFAPSTMHVYKARLEKRIIPALGHIKLNKLQPNHLLDFYNNLAEEGIRLDRLFQIKNKNIFDGMDLKELNKDTGINTRTLREIKNGKQTNENTATKISEYLKKPIAKIFDFTNKQEILSSRTILHHHRLISSVLTSAVQWQLIEINPAQRIKPPKVEKAQVKFYDEDDVIDMFEKLETEPIRYKTMIYIALYGGLRLGEVSALEWSDIDFAENTLNINKQRQYISDVGVIEKAPKTESGLRKIALPNTVVALLKEYKKWQIEEKLKMGASWVDSNKLFTNENGEPIFPNRPTVWFNSFLKRHKLNKIVFHELRHTNASLMIAQGVDVATVSKRLGHSRSSITLDTYSHAIKSKDKEAAEKIDSLLVDSKRKTPSKIN